jgi:membrane protease YdiL (CAAX protease family)
VRPQTARKTWFRLVLLSVPFVFQGLAYLILHSFGLAGTEYSKIPPNIAALIACVLLVHALDLSAAEIGLKRVQGRFRCHAIICVSLLLFLMIFYLFVVRISGLRPVSSGTAFGLLNYLLVAFWEELYFRGILYAVVQKRTSERAALVASALLFGLLHFRQGMGMIPKFLTGFLWGAVRYATGMISFLIPLHFASNSTWLLFEGDWNHPRTYFDNVTLPLHLSLRGAFFATCDAVQSPQSPSYLGDCHRESSWRCFGHTTPHPETGARWFLYTRILPRGDMGVSQ